mmetsp:Transcript_16322/g.39437  ORF Transcript_16322/g.39437 Transcript_16322/m.39437 type:complete len:494 (+) Transcript_16322:95-1576(+)|eukprot:CAMPEP_0180136902 /NCGR_PEP_ID=MMETSP0986-20121125/11837_1 /TAXON_ID=697907 /ORGANISM="non described non described, Strain CCMP2293" /LENGTH=493 /DNA_ID=CAMNT_0022078149 /DNA_START=81 /DNA_END=1562 /DNA_ORIENTATION=+
MTARLGSTQPAMASMHAKATEEIPIGHTTVLSTSDLARIKNTLLTQAASTMGQSIKSEDDQLRDTLRDMSRTRMGTWNNTLEARRAQKENEHASKQDEEEKRRQVQDRDEASFQAGERRRIIQRANTLLYENTERVKAFGSKLYLSDVMKEREMQMDLKKKKDDRTKAEERRWHERVVDGVRKGDAEEAQKQDEAMQRALHAKQVQLDQLEEFRQRYVGGKLDERREGQLIKMRVEHFIQAEKQAETDKKSEEAKRSSMTMKENKRLLEEKRITETQAREDDEKRIQFFAEEKERKMKLRAEREAEISANKQAIRQRMIDRQVAYLQSLRQNENERIAGQVREAEARRDAEISAKNEKLKSELALMRESHRQQVDRKNNEKAADMRRGEEEADKFKSDYDAGVAADRAAEAARRTRRIDLKNYHLKQAKSNMYKKASGKDDELAEQEMVRMKLLEEDLLFEKYSQALIGQYKADGKDIKPLIIELAKMKAEGR